MFQLKSQLFVITFCCAIIAAASPADAQRRKSVFDKEDPVQPKANDSSKSSNQPANGNPTPRKSKSTSPDPSFSDKNEPAGDGEFAPEVVTLLVKKDGISLVATWFPPIVEEEDEEKQEKKRAAKTAKPADPSVDEEELPEPFESIAPFILIHDWSRSRRDMIPLAEFLQSQGHAVIVPDLRGHGDSVEVKGIATELDYRRFKKSQQATAVTDIDRCKRFLRDKNNDEVLNIDLLNVIAVGDSCHLAMAWAISDWNWEPVGGIKQGKDVKSLTLFSPTKTFAGSTLKKLGKAPLFSGRNSPALPMLVVWGAESKANRDCSELIKTLRKNRPEMAQGADLATRWANQDLFDLDWPTAMSGREIAGSAKAKPIWNFANDFVAQKVLTHKEDHPWKLRGAKAVLKNRKNR